MSNLCNAILIKNFAIDLNTKTCTLRYCNLTIDLNNWINRGAICSAAVAGADRTATAYGASGQNIINGPTQMNTDFSLGKSGRVGGLNEDGQLAFRMEMYNALNHPQFSNPGTTLGTASFGVVTQTSVASRIIQFALKYVF